MSQESNQQQQNGREFLPPTIFAQSVCPFLTGDDLLRFGGTCSGARRLIHDASSTEMNMAWKRAVIHDFRLNEDDALTILRTDTSSYSRDIFGAYGYDVRRHIATASNYFESWKAWNYISLCYFTRSSQYRRRKIHGGCK
jgi:hypothetical protein